MSNLLNYNPIYYKMDELAEGVNNHPAVKDKGLLGQISVVALSNEHGVDIRIPVDDCSFRKLMIQRGYTVSRGENQKGIGISKRLRQERMQDAVNIAVAYLFYKNGLLINERGESL